MVSYKAIMAALEENSTKNLDCISLYKSYLKVIEKREDIPKEDLKMINKYINRSESLHVEIKMNYRKVNKSLEMAM